MVKLQNLFYAAFCVLLIANTAISYQSLRDKSISSTSRKYAKGFSIFLLVLYSLGAVLYLTTTFYTPGGMSAAGSAPVAGP